MKRKTRIILITLLIAIVLCFVVSKISFNNAKTSDSVTTQSEVIEVKVYHFRNNKLLKEHYDKHGVEMGYKSKDEYEKGASLVINNRESLHKKEKEDNDDIYYLEKTNEFVIVSKDGYIRTYFKPDKGKSYFDYK